MDIPGTDNTKKKDKKMLNVVKAIIIIVVVLLVLIGGLLVYMSQLKTAEFKLKVDNKLVSSISEDTFIIEGNNVKVKLSSIERFLAGYSFRNGQYGRSSQYSEDRTSCYIQNDNEVASFVQNSKKIEKVVLNEGGASLSVGGNSNNKINYEEYEIADPVEMINDNLYVSLEGFCTGCNVQARYDAKTNTLTVLTLPYVANYYTNEIQEADVMGENAVFSNQKALLYGWVVVKDDKGNVGVNDTKNQMVIGKKYKAVKFIESTKEFIVQTPEDKMGIMVISNQGSKIVITPAYDGILQINDSLYLVSNIDKDNNIQKYGIINKNNKKIVDVDFDEIGLDMNQISKYDVQNAYILYDDCIPVKKDNLWGFFSLSKADLIVEPTYDEIGCIIGTSTASAASNGILVPDYEGIVVKKDEKYGLINSSGKVLINMVATKFYENTINGKTEYFFTYNDQEYNLVEFLIENGIQPVRKEKPVEETENNNENTEAENTAAESNTGTENTIETTDVNTSVENTAEN